MEERIEHLIRLALKAYRKQSKGCKEYYNLEHHIPTELYGHTFTHWQEYAAYKVGEFIKDKLPDSEVDVYLDGYDTNLTIKTNDEDKLNDVITKMINEFES